MISNSLVENETIRIRTVYLLHNVYGILKKISFPCVVVMELEENDPWRWFGIFIGVHLPRHVTGIFLKCFIGFFRSVMVSSI